MKDSLSELAGRVEAAEGASKTLDALIWIALDPDREWLVGHEPGRFPQKPIYGPISTFIGWLNSDTGNQCADALPAPAYTASIDAALQLVPEGLAYCILGGPDVRSTASLCRNDTIEHDGEAKTPALALCAAALKARSAANG